MNWSCGALRCFAVLCGAVRCCAVLIMAGRKEKFPSV